MNRQKPTPMRLGTRTARPPRFLPEVLLAICELKETGGSNSHRIVSHVKSAIGGGPAPRNISTQVQRALKHATTNGIVMQRAGRFQINKALLDPFKDCDACRRRRRRGGRKGRRRRRRRGRSHSGYRSDSYSHGFGSESEEEDFPFRELRRRRRRKGRGRRRRRRSRSHHALPETKHDSDDSKGDEEFKEDPVYSDDHTDDNITVKDDR